MSRNKNKREEDQPRLDNPRDDRQSNEEFPGYPHYPSTEDITLNGRKEDLDVENISRQGNPGGTRGSQGDGNTNRAGAEIPDDEIGIVPGTSADVTRDEIRMLEATDGMQPTSRLEDTDEIQEALDPSDLDIPGAEIDDENESIGEEDEENNYFSLGGDRMENLEEDQS